MDSKEKHIVVFVDTAKDFKRIYFELRAATVNYTVCKCEHFGGTLIFGESKTVRVDIRIIDPNKIPRLHPDYVYHDYSLMGSHRGFSFLQQYMQTSHNEQTIDTFEHLIELIEQEVAITKREEKTNG